MTPGLKPIVTSKPYELVGVDIREIGLTSYGNRYKLSMIDNISKFDGAYAIPSKTGMEMAGVFFERDVFFDREEDVEQNVFYQIN
uniref:Peptidase A1 domain-containing protein n=1 Tax=Haemonchus contortus TaxID=6289 RepID=A0A7I4Z303_HAECO